VTDVLKMGSFVDGEVNSESEYSGEVDSECSRRKSHLQPTKLNDAFGSSSKISGIHWNLNSKIYYRKVKNDFKTRLFFK